MIPLHILGWTEGQTEGQTEVKQYTPCPVERGYNQNIGVQLSLFQNKFMVKKLPLNLLFLYYNILLPTFENANRMGEQVTVTTLPQILSHYQSRKWCPLRISWPLCFSITKTTSGLN
jgi:hypothetical protein